MIWRESEQVHQMNKAPPEMHNSSLQELLMKGLVSPASEAPFRSISPTLG